MRRRPRRHLIAIACTAVVSAFSAPPSYAQTIVISDRLHRAIELLQHKEYAKALDLVEAELRAHPRDAWTLATRGNIYVELGRYERAQPDHDAVLEMRPHDS